MAGVVTVVDVNKRLCNAYAVKTNLQKRAQYVAAVAAVYAMYISRASKGMGRIWSPPAFFIKFFRSVPRIHFKRYAGKVSCAVEHF